jgi:zinc protease
VSTVRERGDAATLAPTAATTSAERSRTDRVEEINTPGGVRAYLIREASLPFLSMAVHFRGGAASDPADRPGLANLVSGLLDEGAGPYDSQAFRRELEDHAIRVSFDADRDGVTGELKTLTAHRERAFELLRLALTSPRFDEEPVGRVRGQILADLRRREADPDYLASRRWFAEAFPDHPYGHPTRGTPESLAAIGINDIRAFAATRLGRDNLYVGVAGDITADELAPRLDRVFAALPERAERPAVPAVAPTTGRTAVTRLPIPQSVVTFGTPGVARQDPEHYAAYIANYILGGGGFASRLTEQVREKRGLAYSVYSYLYDLDSSPLWLGGVSTNNGQVAESLRLIRHEMAGMAAGEISEDDLRNAKTYLTGSFALRLTSNDQVARTLVGMLVQDLGRDFLERRNGLVEAVTLDEVKRASARVFGAEPLVSIAGMPEGIDG